MKCYGEFICSNCGAITKKSFDINSEEDIENLFSICICGKEVRRYIPTSIRSAILCLAQKGYKIRMIYEDTMGIAFVPKQDIHDVKFPKDLPYEFSYDTTEEEADIIVNARLAERDFEGIDEKQYRKEAAQNLFDWVSKLPVIDNNTLYIDRTKEKSSVKLANDVPITE